jgi:hypothetical protein
MYDENVILLFIFKKGIKKVYACSPSAAAAAATCCKPCEGLVKTGDRTAAD